MRRFFYLIGILIIAGACKEVYDVPPQAMLQVSFVNSATENKMSSKVTAWGIGTEQLLVKDSVLQGMIFPLSPTDTTVYMISLDSFTDTITFIHETTLKYASMETGFYYEYKLHAINYSNNRIDTIHIVDSLVTKKWHENIKLYLHPLSAGSN
jgi:hypothetical protein